MSDVNTGHSGWGYVGIMEKKMETTGLMGLYRVLEYNRICVRIIVSTTKIRQGCITKLLLSRLHLLPTAPPYGSTTR